MEHSAQTTKATKALSLHMEKGATGRLGVGRGLKEVSVYLMKGEIVSAEAGNDTAFLISRLVKASLITETRGTELSALVELGEPVFGLLLEEVEPSAMETILFERFRDDLARFVDTEERPSFTPLSAVFVDNLQMGHDSAALLADAIALADEANRVSPNAAFVALNDEGATPEERFILDAIAPGRTAAEIMAIVPLEPIAARALIAAMYDEERIGLADEAEIEPDAEDASGEAEEDVDAIDPSAVALDTAMGEVAPDGPTGDVEGAGEEDLAETEVIDRAEKKRREVSEDAVTEMIEDPQQIADLTRRAILEAQSHPSEAQGIPGGIPFDDAETTGGEGYKAWRVEASAVEDTELEAFADNDYTRGSAAGGERAYTTETHNLDRVEVAEDIQRADITENEQFTAPEEEAIEVGEAPQAAFGARFLGDDEAMQKIDVANDVIEQIVDVWDNSEGAGSGLATMQLLVDGSPARYTALFHQIKLTPQGTLPHRHVLRNLTERPPTEHRQLLNQGLLDLIERALSYSMDEISDDNAIDELLEKTAGYRQRIGL